MTIWGWTRHLSLRHRTDSPVIFWPSRVRKKSLKRRRRLFLSLWLWILVSEGGPKPDNPEAQANFRSWTNILITAISWEIMRTQFRQKQEWVGDRFSLSRSLIASCQNSLRGFPGQRRGKNKVGYGCSRSKKNVMPCAGKVVTFNLTCLFSLDYLYVKATRVISWNREWASWCGRT